MKTPKILSLPEYLEEKKKYYTGKGNEDKVIKCFSPSGYEYWTKHKTLDDIGKIYWKHEPLMERYFSKESEVIDQLKKNPDYAGGICGCDFRWIPGNFANSKEVCLQPGIIPLGNTERHIEGYYNLKLGDHILGMLYDPFIFTGELNDGGIVLEPGKLEIDHYIVFCTEMTKDEYDKEEQDYIGSIHGGTLDDGLITLTGKHRELKQDFLDLLKKYTKSWS